MTARILPFEAGRRASAGGDAGQSNSETALRAEIERLERLEHDLQVEAHRINLVLGEIHRRRWALVKQVRNTRSA